MVVLTAIFGSLAASVVAIIVFPFAMLSAWIRCLLWGWFVVPYLHLPMVPFWAMLGFGLLAVTFASADAPNGYEPTMKEKIERIMMSVFVQMICLGIGFVVHRYLIH